MEFKVSVIIPVFNGEKYIKAAILSANDLPQVGEILVINDGSKDNTYNIIKNLQKNYPKVKVLQHLSGLNLGRSASRNLGIKNAQFQYIAFLDADDYYLPNRFEIDMYLFNKNPQIDGIYGATIAEFENNTAKKLFYERFDNSLTTINKNIDPDFLLEALLFGGYGHFTTDAITLKKEVFLKAGYFNEALFLSEDSHLWYRVAACCHLYGGSIEHPIAIRRVHENNTIHTKGDIRNKQQKILYESLFSWCLTKSIDYNKQNLFFIAYQIFGTNSNNDIRLLFKYSIKNFKILKSKFFYHKLYQLLIKKKK
jgi:glycosyltransferase involved in cell wall biosynthesis